MTIKGVDALLLPFCFRLWVTHDCHFVFCGIDNLNRTPNEAVPSTEQLINHPDIRDVVNED